MKLHTFVRIAIAVAMLVGAFLAGQQSARPVAAQSRQKWEYQIVGSGFTGSGQVERLNKLGEDGWEAITINGSNRVLLRRAK